MHSYKPKAVRVTLSAFLALAITGCEEPSPEVLASVRIKSVSAFLSRPGAPLAKALPAIDVDAPSPLLPRDSSIAILDERLDVSGRRAFIGIKDSASARFDAAAVLKPHPLRPNRLVRQGVRSALTAADVDLALADVENRGADVVRYYENLGLALIRIPKGRLLAIRSSPRVSFVSPDDMALRTDGLNALPARSLRRQGSQETPWGLVSLRIPQGWSYSQGNGAKLLVIDVGYDRGHQDLPLIPESNCMGAYDGCNPPYLTSHGTIVLGVAAATNNSYGIIGAAPGIPANDIYFWGACREGVQTNDCFFDEVAAALNWAAQSLGQYGVANMSFSDESGSPALATAVSAAAGAGVILVAAAGNQGGGPQARYPAGYSNVIAVSGMRADSTFASSHSPCTTGPGSNWGPHISFTGPWEAKSTANQNGYVNDCGTSVAAPYVAGVIALVRAKLGPSAGVGSVVNQIGITAKKFADTDRFGAGLPRADLAMGFTATDLTSYVIQNGKPKLTWASVPLATEYRIYRRVTPTLAPEWALWAVRTTTTYTDISTNVSSIWNPQYNCTFWPPSQTAVSYQVRSYNSVYGIEQPAGTCATYFANGTPPF